MAKSRWRRTWIKMYVNESLEGTIRFDFTPAERGVWYDLILLAGRCRIPGVISANENAPYPHKYIAGLLNIDQELFETTLEKCIKSKRIIEDKRGIVLVNWEHYQSEYDRQKKYRQKEDPDKYTRGVDDDTHISGQSIEQCVRIARGELEASRAVKERIQRELDRRGISWEVK